ncbi:hypothetical protein Val02_69410 [Virgisporangium aliadipatigenens]|uniref:YDG domain-containing protein n=1 Tax=Virgisporangium aliadipatigenens TaxID=741659 RepID=A0A8J3YUG2_9ACTN|nr:YDG/SRA domain-containing protein [Virgisporangium aliadipatigenens]GIJ50055.1 hypothetical protein Val02_69410 [Virgisporangium aliadipatigenens]
MADRTYGEIPGYPVGSAFTNRAELAKSGVHRPNQAGICGGKDGAESIVVSGGYPDDEDFGNEIIYTGHGGNDPQAKRQIAHQKLIQGNAGLARNQFEGNPVRVIRGAGGDNDQSPASGFRYDGLFRVVDHWHEIGKDGYRIWRFRLTKIDSNANPSPASRTEPAGRASATIQRIIRSSANARRVKELHDHRCQVCGLRLETPAGPYSEAAHIKPLGRPHDGPDVQGNILCLCPNHHVLLDSGAIYVDDHSVVRSAVDDMKLGELRTAGKHIIDYTFVKYHREHYGISEIEIELHDHGG